jgi:hypothetical protein
LKIIRKDSKGVIISNQNATISYNASINEFIAALNKFDSYASYRISGIRKMLNAANVETNDSSLAVTIVWTINIDKLRTSAFIK